MGRNAFYPFLFFGSLSTPLSYFIVMKPIFPLSSLLSFVLFSFPLALLHPNPSVLRSPFFLSPCFCYVPSLLIFSRGLSWALFFLNELFFFFKSYRPESALNITLFCLPIISLSLTSIIPLYPSSLHLSDSPSFYINCSLFQKILLKY